VAFRAPWADAARGIAIILVVFHHICAGLENAHIAGDALVLLHKLLQIPMLPIFLFVSGIFAAKSLRSDRHDFLNNRVLVFVYLYLVWSMIDFSSRWIMSSYTNNVVGPERLLYILWMPLFGNWFIYALAIFFIVARATRGVPRFLKLVAGVVLYFAAFSVSSQGHTSLLHDLMKLYIFFAIGVDYREEAVAALRSLGSLGSMLLLAAYVASFLVLWRMDMSQHPAAQAVLTLSSTAAVLRLCMGFEQARLTEGLGWVGRRSLEIYLMNFLPAGATHIAARLFGVTEWPLTIALVGTVATVILCILARIVAERIGLGFLFRLPAAWHLRAGSPPAPASASPR
jgi:uncharacterized membrane protein YcfT